jgi:hypothetical protein
MELDGYCEELRLAFEHHGIQHYQFTPFFHSNQKFKRTQELDREKLEVCRLHEVQVILIRWDCSDLLCCIQEHLRKGGNLCGT